MSWIEPNAEAEATRQHFDATRQSMRPFYLAEAALEYVGTPWLHQGRLKGVGVDCVGLLVCAAREIGYKVDDIPDYPRRSPNKGWLVNELQAQLTRVKPPWQVGDVLAFQWRLEPWHVAVVTRLSPLTVVHAFSHIGRVAEMPLDPWWQRHIHSCWRLPE